MPLHEINIRWWRRQADLAVCPYRVRHSPLIAWVEGFILLCHDLWPQSITRERVPEARIDTDRLRGPRARPLQHDRPRERSPLSPLSLAGQRSVKACRVGPPRPLRCEAKWCRSVPPGQTCQRLIQLTEPRSCTAWTTVSRSATSNWRQHPQRVSLLGVAAAVSSHSTGLRWRLLL